MTDERVTVSFVDIEDHINSVAGGFLEDVMSRKTTIAQKKERILRNLFQDPKPIKSIRIYGKNNEIGNYGLELFPEIESIEIDLTMGSSFPVSLSKFPKEIGNNLKNVDIIADVTTFEGLPTNMPKLETLKIQGNYSRWGRTESTSQVPFPTINIPSIKNITIQNTNIGNLSMMNSPFADLNKIQCISCGLTNFMPSHTDPIPKITEINIENNKITSFTSFPAMPSLVNFNMKKNKLQNIAGIEKFPALRYLSLEENSLNTIDGMNITNYIENVNLTENNITEITNAHINAGIITLYKNNLNSVRGLHVSNTNELRLTSNKLSNIDLPIETMAHLKKIDLNSNALTSLQGLNAPQLTELEISHNKLKSLSGATSMPNLTNINLEYNDLVSPETMPSIHPRAHLDLEHNPLRNLHGLTMQQFLRAKYSLNSFSPMSITMSKKCGQYNSFNRPKVDEDASYGEDCNKAYTYLTKSFESEFEKFNDEATSTQDRQTIFNYLIHEAHPIYKELIKTIKPSSFTNSSKQFQYDNMLQALHMRFEDFPLVYEHNRDDD